MFSRLSTCVQSSVSMREESHNNKAQILPSLSAGPLIHHPVVTMSHHLFSCHVGVGFHQALVKWNECLWAHNKRLCLWTSSLICLRNWIRFSFLCNCVEDIGFTGKECLFSNKCTKQTRWAKHWSSWFCDGPPQRERSAVALRSVRVSDWCTKPVWFAHWDQWSKWGVGWGWGVHVFLTPKVIFLTMPFKVSQHHLSTISAILQ